MKKGLTLEVVGDALGRSRQYAWQLMNGHTLLMSYDIFPLALALDLTAKDVIQLLQKIHEWNKKKEKAQV